MKISVFQHVPFEGPASLQDWAAMRGHELSFCNLFHGDSLPELSEYGMLLVLGGPMGVHDEADYPWLAEEKAYIRRAIDAGKPMLGICLGAQLIADVLGAEVKRHDQREIGWFPIEHFGNHPLAHHFDNLVAFHWHGDTFDIPAGAHHIARSECCENQAFIYRDRVLGLQFHLEFTPETVRRLVEHCCDEIDGGPYTQRPDDMLTLPARFAKANMALYNLLDDWVKQAHLQR